MFLAVALPVMATLIGSLATVDLTYLIRAGDEFFAVLLLIVTERRAHPRLLWVVPPLVLVWANIHGSFFLAPLVLGLAWLEDLNEHAPHPHRTLAVAVVSALAACVTPFGPTVWI